jgi:hypothetical protein
MSSLAFAIPLPPGKTEAWRRFMDELKGPRHAEVQDMLRRAQLTQHNFYLQQTPRADLAIVYLEGDVAHAFHHFATSDHPFERWVRQQVLETEGIDLTQPPPGPPPEVVLEAAAAEDSVARFTSQSEG